MKRFYHPDFKLGILGGGQLGRMLIQAATDLDISIHILDPDKNAPCSVISHHFIEGSLTDFDTVYNFGKDKDLLTIEIEHVNADALTQLENEGVKVYPQPNLIKIVQDKGLQKQFYANHGIPTSGFELIDSPDPQQLESRIPFVQKLRKGGYDGKGVQVIRSVSDLDKCFTEPCILEELIDFEKEISVIVSRNESGEIKSFPVVDMDFNPEANLVEFLFSPASVSEQTEQEARKIAEKLIQEMGMVGILAVEMFITKSGEILVNEVAPRPHNSGHQTIEANITSQYEQHLRSMLDLPLGDTSIIEPSVMINLLGEKGYEGKVYYEGIEKALAIPGVHIHIYGKEFTKPFRKMGHATITGETLELAREKALQVKAIIKVKSESP